MILPRLVFFMLIVCLTILPYWNALAASPIINLNQLNKEAPKPAYTIKPHAEDQAFLQHEYKTYPGPIEGLLSASPTWTGFFRQKGRDIRIDFGQLQTIQRLSMDFKHEPAKGILLPDYMEAFISNDGRNWSRLGRVDVLKPTDEAPPDYRTLSLVFPPMSIRYVKLSFPVEQWVFGRRLSFGQEDHLSNIKPVLPSYHETTSPTTASSFLSIPNIHDIALIYTGDHGQAGVWKKEEFMPMLSYLRPDGQYQDRMFDAFLFLPYPTITRNWEDWDSYMEDLFAPGQQLDALNKAAETLQKRPKVILTMAYPAPHHRLWDPLRPAPSILSFPFADEEPKETWMSKREAMEAYFHRVWEKWNESPFSHLDLVGFYWLPETIDQTLSHEVELVQYAAQMVQQKNLKFFWIPYFGSVGYDRWKTFGFDYVFLQPNYYATLTPAEDRMENAADIAKRHQFGIELELDERILNNRYYYDLFYKQLDQAKRLGLDKKATHAYYLGGRKTMVLAALSPIPEARQLYDDLYKWMKGVYK